MMKQAPPSEPDVNDDLRPEYTFDDRTACPNRCATHQASADAGVVVVLDPDIARVFTTPEAVNTILRALIQNMPDQSKCAA